MGAFFWKSSLRSARQKVQLGHKPGDACTSPQWSTHPFTVIHINGIHLVDIWFCSCDLTGDHRDCVEQLLQHHLFPATTTDLQTALTFALLEYVHILSVQSKLSLYDLYISIKISTDVVCVSGIKVCVQCFFYYHHSPLTYTKGLLPRVPPNY